MTPRYTFTQTIAVDDENETLQTVLIVTWDVAYYPTENGIAFASRSVESIKLVVNGFELELPRVHKLPVQGGGTHVVDAYHEAALGYWPLVDKEELRKECERDWTGAGHITWNQPRGAA